MDIRATLKLRHEILITARESLGMSQKEFACYCDVPFWHIYKLECLQFKYVPETTILKIAAKAKLLPENIMPDDFVGTNLEHTFIKKQAIENGRLLEEYKNLQKQRLLVASPTDIAEIKLEFDEIKEHMESLTYQEREILRLRYGIDQEHEYTLAEVGRIFKVSVERVRAVESKAIRKIQRMIDTKKRRRENIPMWQMEELLKL